MTSQNNQAEKPGCLGRTLDFIIEYSITTLIAHTVSSAVSTYRMYNEYIQNNPLAIESFDAVSTYLSNFLNPAHIAISIIFGIPAYVAYNYIVKPAYKTAIRLLSTEMIDS